MQQTKNSRSRGKESNDDKLFAAPKMQAKISECVKDINYLLNRGYALKSSLALAGNRYRLNARQQRAVQGMCASSQEITYRNQNSLKAEDLQKQEILLDGFNVLILLESMLSGAYVFKGADGFYRDLSGVHGSYKKVSQTFTALELVKNFHVQTSINKLHWYLDKPVSNSGRLKKIIEELASLNNLNWEVSLCYSPDKELAKSGKIVVSSDAWILDNAPKNFNLLHYLLPQINNCNVFSIL